MTARGQADRSPEPRWWTYGLGGVAAIVVGVRIALDTDAASSIAEWGLAVCFVALGLLMAATGVVLHRR